MKLTQKVLSDGGTMSNAMSKIFNDQTIKESIDAYIKDNINNNLKGIYKKFLKNITQRIKETCEFLFSHIEKIANSQSKTYSVEVKQTSAKTYRQLPIIDKNGLNVILNCFTKVFIIGNFDAQRVFYGQQNQWANVLPKPMEYTLTFYWSPENRFIYGQNSNIPKQLECPPVQHNSIHYEKAIKGEGTDISLQNNNNEMVHLHSIYLKNHTSSSDYVFKKENSEEETNFMTLNCSMTTLNNIQQYIYLNTLGVSSLNNMDDLLDLLKSSSVLLCKGLYELSRNLLEQHLENLRSDQKIDRLLITTLAQDLDIVNDADLLRPLLLAAEELETTNNNEIFSTGVELSSVDWKKIPQSHLPQIARLADQLNLTHLKIHFRGVPRSFLET